MSVHAVPLGKAARTLLDMIGFVEGAREDVHDFIWATYEVSVEETPEKKVEQKAEEKPEEKEPEAVPVPVAQTKTTAPADKAPPAAAQAAQTLTANDDPYSNEKVDFTMVQGAGNTYAGGVTASNGSSDKAVFDRGARGDGVPGGTGSGAPPAAAAPKPDTPDQTRVAKPTSGSWNCSSLFPAEADQDDINEATVSIIVTVGPDGTAKGVKIVANPKGHGFDRAARACALSQSYTPPLDRDGQPTRGDTPPFTVRFTR